MIAFVAPNPSVDKLFVTDAVVVGEIHRPERLIPRAGGKGLNAARAAHALGGDVVAVALLAGHAGRWIAEALAAGGVRADVTWGEGESRHALSVAGDGGLTEFYERGDPPGARAWKDFTHSVRGRARGAAWLSISGSMPPDVSPDEAAGLVQAGRAAGARVAIDQHGPTLAAALTAGPDLVKVNREEATEQTGEDDPERAVAALRAHAVAGGAPDDDAVAIVTLGEDGALACLPGGALLHGDLDVRAPYPTGSGDAFLGGLLHAREDGAEWDGALAIALGAACANAEAEGAGSLDPERARVLAVRARERVRMAATP